RVNVGAYTLELDSNSTVSLNSLRFHPWLRYEGGRYESAWARLRTPQIPAQEIIDAMPQGTLETVQGMKAAGSLSFFLDFHYTTQLPDTVVFDFQVRPRDFRIDAYGRARLTMLNDTFVYRPHFSARKILVGSANPHYVDLGNISKNLINAVHYSEDGALFYHNGFSLEAFKEAIIDNFKHKRFRRGASTITMQLVKNVFLSPEKTLERKVEEAVLVWLITQNHLVKRPRMLEVYLNIIEWGPEVFGAWEASQFYFKKDPAWLSLEEGIFLAMIVPSPRSFMYFLNDSTLQVSDLHEPYFQMMGRILARKKVITEEQAEKIDYRKVLITGRARQVAEQWRDRIRGTVQKKQVNGARSSVLTPSGTDKSQASAAPFR
ncbi:MAG: transglycosylase domain-containing protein, partial [Bacteroidetes bacterium]|nr:transglycosylase domain-containing protein [Bacteroidota bacterium]